MKYFQELQQTKVFKMASEFDCQALMFCFKTRFKIFEKNQPIVTQGEQMEEVVLIVKGGGNVENIDSLGNISIVSRLKRGDVYGIESAYSQDEVYKDSVIATEKSLILFMNKHRLITPCENRCKRHELILRNLMEIVAESNTALLEKLTHMTKKTIREKLLSYLSLMSVKSNSEYFEIPFNKTELANYLSVDRSAMTTELSRMREEGIVDFDKKLYRLIHYGKK